MIATHTHPLQGAVYTPIGTGVPIWKGRSEGVQPSSAPSALKMQRRRRRTGDASPPPGLAEIGSERGRGHSHRWSFSRDQRWVGLSSECAPWP